VSPDETNAEVLRLLRSIQADVAQIRADVLAGRAGGATTPTRPSGSTTGSGYNRAPSNGAAQAGGDIADDRDLDGPHGDPSVKKDPPRWSGQSFAGYHLSECPPDFLECFASFKDWQADKDDESDKRDAKGRSVSTFSRKDAARARGWAKRLRENGGASPAAAPAVDNGYDAAADAYAGGGDEDLPF
jgi:hypothetical protein